MADTPNAYAKRSLSFVIVFWGEIRFHTIDQRIDQEVWTTLSAVLTCFSCRRAQEDEVEGKNSEYSVLS